jgi:DNA primase
VNIVSQYVPLQRSGRNFTGRCPWHDDSRPSLQVNPDRQTYKCWVCDIGGDVFSFIMKIENIDFKEALELLADKAGITIPKHKRQITDGRLQTADGSGDGQQKEITKKDLLRAADWITGIYHNTLLESEEAEPARKYLAERNITDSDIETFQLGYAPLDNNFITGKVKRFPQRLQVLELIGNIVNRSTQDGNTASGSNYYDRFRGRLMFPITDAQGRTVGFGGRLIPGIELNSPAKYVNSPETILFSKHQLLYGLHQAKQKIKETKSVLIMEGYTDVITAHRFGFSNAVAVLGTALGMAHVQILKRYADKMYLVLDGDEAGRKRAAQVLEHFVSVGADMSVLTLPAGLDPADYLNQYGSETLEELLRTRSVDVLEHAYQTAVQGIDVKQDIVGSTNALNQILTLIAKAPAAKHNPNDPLSLRIEKTIQSISLRFMVNEQTVRSRMKELRNTAEIRRRTVQRNDETENVQDESEPSIWDNAELLPDDVETEMLELWLNDPTVIYEFWDDVPVERCRSPLTQMIYQKANEIIDSSKTVTFERLLTAFDDPQMKKFLVDLDERAAAKLKNKITGGTENKNPAAYRDNEIEALEESIRPLQFPPELKKELIGKVIEAFSRRDEEYSRNTAVNLLRKNTLSEDERNNKLRQLQEVLRKKQEEKKKQYP